MVVGRPGIKFSGAFACSQELPSSEAGGFSPGIYWAAVTELNSSYYIGETLLFITDTHHGTLI